MLYEVITRIAKELGRPVFAIAPETLALLQSYVWPGNVRELQNVIERGVLYCAGETLRPGDLPEMIAAPEKGVSLGTETGSLPGLGRPLPELLEEMESQLIGKALVQARGVQAQAAELLGISRSNLQYKLKKYGIVITSYSIHYTKLYDVLGG